MVRFLWRRTWHALLLLWLMSLLVFIGVFAIGNPATLLVDPQADAQTQAQSLHALGLDLPLWQQYLHFLQRLVHGDLGTSFVSGEPALQLILSRLPATLELALVAMALALLLGVPLGLYAGLRPHAWGARLVQLLAVMAVSLPTFWIGLLAIQVFAVWLGWLPASGRGPTTSFLGVPISLLSWSGWRHVLLPAATLGLFKLGLMVRLTASGATTAARQDYVRFARAKGLRPARVLWHILRNILVPLVTVSGLELGSLVAFAAVTETVFSWPGIGKLLIDAITSLDRPLVVAYLLLTLALFILLNTVADILYALIDPRIRQEGAP